MIPTILVKPLLELAVAGLQRLTGLVRKKPKAPADVQPLTFRDVTHIQDQIRHATMLPPPYKDHE